MDLEEKFKQETGFDAYVDNDLRPKVYRDYYVEWLEKQLALCNVSNWVACKDRTPEKVGVYDVWQGEVFKAHWRDGVWKEVGGSKPTGYGGKLRREVKPTYWTIIKPPCD